MTANNIFTQFKSWALGTIQKAGQNMQFVSDWVRYAFPDFDFWRGVEIGYKKNSAVYACVRALAFAFPEPSLIAYKDSEFGLQPVRSDDPLQKLIRTPNPDMGEAEFMQFAITFCPLGGNLYIWKERSVSGKVIALWPFSDKEITPVAGHNPSEGIVAGYEFNSGDGHKFYLDKKDVIQWKWMIDPITPWSGMSALRAAWEDVIFDRETSNYAFSTFKNDAIPPMVVTSTEDTQLTDEDIERMKAQWRARYGGKERGVPAFLEYGMTVQKMGYSMQELNMTELKNIPESRICAGFGVPPTIALLYVGLKRSDYGDGEARKSFTVTTLVSLWRTLSSELTSSLSDDFGGGYTLRFDMNQVRALQENVKELWDRALGAMNASAITRGDFKRLVGLRAGPEDEFYKTSLITGWEPAGKAPSSPAGDISTQKFLSTTLSRKSGEGAMEKKALSHVNAVYGRALQRIRLASTQPMMTELNSYFATLSDRIISRAEKGLKVAKETKEFPSAEDLVSKKDEADLNKILKRWYVGIAQASWETINLSLGVTLDFELTDPAITKMLAGAGNEVREITETTRQALRDALKYANKQGWSIQELVNGDETQAGLRSIVEETYKNRSVTIARTELGNAQNSVTTNRYKDNGVQNVGVLDNGDTDDDEECKLANGQIWSLEYSQVNALEHPNCTRCFYPILEDVTPDRS